jgi:hypothetical protein
MVTNALSPTRVIVGLQDSVPSDGLIGIMPSDQGSVSNNEKAEATELPTLFAIASAAGSWRRRSRASLPLPVSTSTN